MPELLPGASLGGYFHIAVKKKFVLLQTNSHEIALRGVKGSFGGAGKGLVD